MGIKTIIQISKTVLDYRICRRRVAYAYNIYYRTYAIVLQCTYVHSRGVNIIDGGGKIQQSLYSCTRISYSIIISETTAAAPRVYLCAEGLLYMCICTYI